MHILEVLGLQNAIAKVYNVVIAKDVYVDHHNDVA